MEIVKHIIANSTPGFLYLTDSKSIDEKKVVQISQITYLSVSEDPLRDDRGKRRYHLRLYIGPIRHKIIFDDKEEAIEGREMLVSFIGQNSHSNEVKDLKNDSEELKEMIKCLPGLGSEYLKAKDHFHNSDSK